MRFGLSKGSPFRSAAFAETLGGKDGLMPQKTRDAIYRGSGRLREVTATRTGKWLRGQSLQCYFCQCIPLHSEPLYSKVMLWKKQSCWKGSLHYNCALPHLENWTNICMFSLLPFAGDAFLCVGELIVLFPSPIDFMIWKPESGVTRYHLKFSFKVVNF